MHTVGSCSAVHAIYFHVANELVSLKLVFRMVVVSYILYKNIIPTPENYIIIICWKFYVLASQEITGITLPPPPSHRLNGGRRKQLIRDWLRLTCQTCLLPLMRMVADGKIQK